jgi:hypothetical protein
MEKQKHLIGKVKLKSDLSIVEVGEIISDKILGGIVLDGLEKNIYDEVPAIFAQNGLLGFSVILQGYSGKRNDIGFWFELIPNFSEGNSEVEIINLSNYLTALFKSKITHEEIIVIDEAIS